MACAVFELAAYGAGRKGLAEKRFKSKEEEKKWRGMVSALEKKHPDWATSYTGPREEEPISAGPMYRATEGEETTPLLKKKKRRRLGYASMPAQTLGQPGILGA